MSIGMALSRQTFQDATTDYLQRYTSLLPQEIQMVDNKQVLDFGSGKNDGAASSTGAKTPLDSAGPPQTSSPNAPTRPDGEKVSNPENDPNTKPGDSQADPNNLAKDSLAGGGLPIDKQAGAASLGAQPGNAGAGAAGPVTGDERVVAQAVKDAPPPEGKIRTSFAEQGHQNS